MKTPPKKPITKTKPAVDHKKPAPKLNDVFPLVGIGASAGGLEALEQFLENVPANSGMAFVIIQHLDPTRQGIMSELLQRITPMKVLQVKDRTRVKRNCVYIIPPNKDMSILHGVLHLLVPSAPRGLRLPIDFFFHSLALDRKEYGIGVILSGMGSDGMLGLRAIKESAGVALVQDPESAKFDGMPRSAIDAGLADIVGAAGALPAKIIAYLGHTPLVNTAVPELDDKSHNALEKVILLLRSHTRHDFSLYKRNTLYRRIERRMGLHQIDKMGTYVRYLQENPQELDLLFKELLIGVTSFFRDPSAWEHLGGEAIPALLSNKPEGQALRAWVPGCSTGEEAFSLAIVLKEAASLIKPKSHIAMQVFATDLDRDAIDVARQGFYSENITACMSSERLARFFVKEKKGYRVHKEIREMVIFASQDIILDPPFTKLDILSCRNLLIYLTPEVQKKLIPLFHYTLGLGGILFLGSSESIGSFTDLFATLDGPSRLFQRKESTQGRGFVEFPSSFSSIPAMDTAIVRLEQNPLASLQTLADQLILQRYAPPAVLANDKGDILYISGRTGKYLEPAAGKANWNIFAMVREGLRYELTNAFQKATRQNECILLHGLKIEANDVTQCVDVSVQKLEASGPLQGLVMIIFTDVALPAKAIEPKPKSHTHNVRLEELEQDLVHVRAESQASREAMQTSQEELRSANEELQSTNEELQSTNEELTTSKEEMQSMNEELQSLNSELQLKLDELSQTGNDMKNLLDSTNVATLFLDKELNVRRFTPQVTKIIKLIPSDLGRPVTDLTSALRYPELAEDAQQVLKTLVHVEKPIGTGDKRWFSVRIMPYHTLDDRIDGVVITFSDITDSKVLESKLRERQSVLENHVAKQDVKLAVKSKKGREKS